jgi:hypothetical protein
MSGKFQEMATLLQKEDVSPGSLDAFTDALEVMDDSWGRIVHETLWALMSLVSLSSDKGRAHEACKVFEKFFLLMTEIFVNDLRIISLEDEAAADLDSLIYAENVQKGLDEYLKTGGQLMLTLSPLGKVFGRGLLGELPTEWFDHLRNLVQARDIVENSLEDDAGIYFGEMLLDMQEDKAKDFDNQFSRSVLSLNSNPYQEAEEWAAQAESLYSVFSRLGASPDVAASSVVFKVGAPWIQDETEEPEEFEDPDEV